MLPKNDRIVSKMTRYQYWIRSNPCPSFLPDHHYQERGRLLSIRIGALHSIEDFFSYYKGKEGVPTLSVLLQRPIICLLRETFPLFQFRRVQAGSSKTVNYDWDWYSIMNINGKNCSFY